MASKRKQRRAKPVAEKLSQPSKWRLQHGSFSDPVRAADPETGAPLIHRRAVDTLGLMLTNDTITPAMHDAGAAFRSLFRAAALDSLRTSPLIRIQGGKGDQLTDRHLDARRRVGAMLDALGGQDSVAGSCVWYVVGCEASIREWATRQGWRGKPVGHSQAQGILVAALGMLAGHRRGTPGGSHFLFFDHG